MKSIKVTAGPNKMELPGNGTQCSYCKRTDLPLQDCVLWRSCSKKCEFAFSYLLDGISSAEVKEKWQGWKDDPAEWKKAVDRVNNCVFIEPQSRLRNEDYKEDSPGYAL